MRITVLDGAVLNPGDISWRPISDIAELDVYDSTSPEQFADRVIGADIVLVNKTLVRAENIPQLSSCKLVGVLATGANNLDLPALAAAGIKACNVPAYGVEDVAQHALALLMELTRATALHSASVLAGEWTASGNWCYWLKTPLSLKDLTLGIIGFGNIGQTMGRIGNAMGMKILACSRHRKAEVDYPFTWADQEQIWQQAHVITLHCPLTEENWHLINAESIAAMRDGAIIINTARGGLVDEEAVAAALKSGKLGGFGADVLNNEPPKADNPLFQAPNVLLTPHMAWATARARQNIIDIMAENIRKFLAGEAENIIN